MAVLTVRNLPDEVHHALRLRAAQHGCSMEAEVRAILENVVKPESRVRVGKALATMSRNIGLTNEDFEGLAQHHDVVPAEPPGLE